MPVVSSLATQNSRVTSGTFEASRRVRAGAVVCVVSTCRNGREPQPNLT